MDAAKAAVANFTSRHGKHETHVDETVAPAVTSEVVKPVKHEEVQQAVDREVHQDHYHTTVQPIQHQEMRPERHSHQMGAVQERSFEHDDPNVVKQKLAHVTAGFKNTAITQDTKHTTAAAPTIEGEHVHHHVHETVQPVIHKETITPEVVHTTVPIHETHHAASQHHGTSTLPVKTLSEFTSGGGILDGKRESHGSYDGCPRPYNSNMQETITEADRDPHATVGGIIGHSGHSHNTAGPHGSNIANKADPRVDSDRDGRSGLNSGTGYPSTSTTTNTTTSTSTGAGPHSSNAANKLDPRVDSDRDGRAGVETGSRSTGTSAGVGPHSSNAANKLDPRVDSDRDGRAGVETGSRGTGTSAGVGTSHTNLQTHSNGRTTIGDSGMEKPAGY